MGTQNTDIDFDWIPKETLEMSKLYILYLVKSYMPYLNPKEYFPKCICKLLPLIQLIYNVHVVFICMLNLLFMTLQIVPQSVVTPIHCNPNRDRSIIVHFIVSVMYVIKLLLCHFRSFPKAVTSPIPPSAPEQEDELRRRVILFLHLLMEISLYATSRQPVYRDYNSYIDTQEIIKLFTRDHVII